jgi:hypothetical protein
VQCDIAEQHAQANLRRTLASLNKSLRSGILEADRDKVGFQDASRMWLDAEVFLELLDSLETHSHSKDETCIQCPTLIILIGSTLILDGLGSRSLVTILGVVGLLYGIMGVVYLHVLLDWVLVLGGGRQCRPQMAACGRGLEYTNEG